MSCITRSQTSSTGLHLNLSNTYTHRHMFSRPRKQHVPNHKKHKNGSDPCATTATWVYVQYTLNVFGLMCLHNGIHTKCPDETWVTEEAGHMAGSRDVRREWRWTCFDWSRGQPRAGSTAAAWGIAALWFFCFGWWKDYLQSPTIAQRLDTHTHRHMQICDFISFSDTRTCTQNQKHTPCNGWVQQQTKSFLLGKLVIACWPG